MKKVRVSVLKHNVQVGDQIPQARNDADFGHWLDDKISENYTIDKFGVVDIPELGIDNKGRKRSSKTHHSVGSQTIEKWLAFDKFEDTDIYKKLQNQNQVTYDSNFKIVTKVRLVDMDISVTQEKLKAIYTNLRQKLVEGNRAKSIYSDCKRGVIECYTHKNSYKLRLTDKYMKEIQNIAASRDTFNKFIELS